MPQVRDSATYYCHACVCWHFQGGEDFLEHMPVLTPNGLFPRPGASVKPTYQQGLVTGPTRSLRIINQTVSGSLPADAKEIVDAIKNAIATEVVKVSS